MIKKILLSLFFIGAYLLAQTNIELISNLDEHHSSGYNDIWGYVDEMGNEYALLGVRNGTSIIDLSDPANPVEVAFIPGTNSIWRDIKTHEQYAYVVSDNTNDGLQIIDLSQLPNTATLVNQTTAFFESSHNIFIDNGFLYVVGTEGGGGMHILDLSNPVDPIETAHYTASDYIHDLYVWDDTVVACAGDSYDLVDVSNKNNPQLISVSSLIPGIYAHSGWMTEDKRYFIAAEESNVRDLIVYDLQDRSTWDVVVPGWQMSGNSLIHNIFVLGNYAHISYYKDGYVVLDISDPTDPKFAGQYDTFPGSGGNFDGAWGCYPYLPSGHVIISDISTGLYVLKFGMPTAVVDEELPISFSLNQNYPNPFNPSTNISFSIPEPGLVTLRVYSILGEEVAELLNEFKEAGNYEINFFAANLPTGIYIAKLSTGNNFQTIKMSLLK
ncbi:MAG: choice-of-anchor B family protein [Bacteroidetes bacterium]|nr:choice-of-anchor B family protein [Bacteroidota bacterium]